MAQDLADPHFKLKVPPGATLVTAIRLPNGQLVELTLEEAPQVSNFRSGFDGGVFLREETQRIDPDNLIRMDRYNWRTPLQVCFEDLGVFLLDFIKRKKGGAETCMFEDYRQRSFGYIDYTANEHCCIHLVDLSKTREQINQLLPDDLYALGVDSLTSLSELLLSERGRARLFGSDAYGFDQTGEIAVEKVLESLWETPPSPDVDHV